jgi:hypothetical protein
VTGFSQYSRSTYQFITKPLLAEQGKKNGATFRLGGSDYGSGGSTGDDADVKEEEEEAIVNDNGEGMNITPFADEVAIPNSRGRPYESEVVFDVFEVVFDDINAEDPGGKDRSGSAIEDDGEEHWEDEPSSPSTTNEATSSRTANEHIFLRIDSRPNLVSQQSLLTSLMHEKDHTAVLLKPASCSTPTIPRSRTTSPNSPLGPSSKNTSQALAQNLTQEPAPASQARPVVMITSNVHPLALSPRTTRLNMLSTELSESLRKNLLLDRKVSRSTTNAALKHRHTTQDMTKLMNFPGESQKLQNATNSWNNYYDYGLQEYHRKGW